jgi:hypothetical protein
MERGQSVNRWATDVLSAAVDPAFAGGDAEALRERLARARLLIPTTPGKRRRPDRGASPALGQRPVAGGRRAISSRTRDGEYVRRLLGARESSMPTSPTPMRSGD